MVTLNMPNATNILNAATDYSQTFFTEYAITVIGVTLGLAVAGLAIAWIVRMVKGFLKTVFGGRRRSRRGRR